MLMKLFKGLCIIYKTAKMCAFIALIICAISVWNKLHNTNTSNLLNTTKTTAATNNIQNTSSLKDANTTNNSDSVSNSNVNSDTSNSKTSAYASTKEKVISGQMNNESRAGSIPLPEGVTLENGHYVSHIKATLGDATKNLINDCAGALN